MVRGVLIDAARKGLPGEHHFFITFDTNAEGVRLSPRLREQYPEEMTIVLQHQYWDLIINDDFFEVTVSFNKQQERIKVPFAALSAFVDPSVRFGLQFDRKDKSGAAPEKAEAPPPTPLPVADKRQPPTAPAGDAVADEAKSESATPAAPEAKPKDGVSKVVKLDSFRKK